MTPWYVTWSVVYEFLRVVTHPRVFRRSWTAEGAWGFVDALLATDSLDVLTETERHARILAELLEALPAASGNLFHDLHTAALMREHGIKTIYTRDTDFHRFPGIEVIDPLSAVADGR